MVDAEEIFGAVLAYQDMTLAARVADNGIAYAGLFENFLNGLAVLNLNEYTGVLAEQYLYEVFLGNLVEFHFETALGIAEVHFE